MKIACLLFGFFVCQFSFANAMAKEDSLKSSPDSYRDDINDPRNPNCPCHKYQKLADEEYRKLLGKDASTSSALVINENRNNRNSNYTNTFSGNSNVNSKTTIFTKKSNSIKRRHSFFNFKKKKSSKRRKVRRLRRDNTSCYHF